MPPKGSRKRAAPPSDADTSAADVSLHRKLVQCGTKTALCNIVNTLVEAGWKPPAVLRSKSTASTRRKLHVAKSFHAKASTPYGTVMQRMALPLTDLPMWSYINPMALLYYLSTLSSDFALMMASCATPGVPLNIILYIDEIAPGNPLRPDRARTLQAVYWAVREWQQ